MYGMVKTTIYIPAPLKERVRRMAAEQSRSEAAVIRDALEAYTATTERPRPTLPLFKSDRGDIARQVDELLADGFGHD
jgi:hypothetical protein